MASVPGFRAAMTQIPGFRFDGSTVNATAPQLVLPQGPRSSISLQNTSQNTIWLEFGGARATATVTNGVVTAVAVVNAGFGYSYAPRVQFLGGSIKNNGLNLGSGYPGYDSPARLARAHCVMTGSAPIMTIASIVNDDPGAGYSNNALSAPYVYLENDPNDTFGCASPYGGGSGSGYSLAPGSTWYEAFSVVATETVAVWSATTGSTFACRITQ